MIRTLILSQNPIISRWLISRGFAPSGGCECEKTYIGTRGYYGCHVAVHSPRGSKPLDPRLDIMNHSPTGLTWGYSGSGPAQLALAILADCVGDEVALEKYQAFKRDVVSSLPYEGWELSAQDIRKWLRTA